MKADYQKLLARDRSYAGHYRNQAAVFRVFDELAQLLRETFNEVAIGSKLLSPTNSLARVRRGRRATRRS